MGQVKSHAKYLARHAMNSGCIQAFIDTGLDHKQAADILGENKPTNCLCESQVMGMARLMRKSF